MDWLTYVFDGLGIIATIVSVISAYKARKYYKKAKCIFQRDKCKESLEKIVKIKDKMMELIKYTNPKMCHCKNMNAVISNIGKDIWNSYSMIEHSLTPNEWKKIHSHLVCNNLDFQNFISILSSARCIKATGGIETFDDVVSHFDEYFGLVDSAYSSLREIVETYENKLT